MKLEDRVFSHKRVRKLAADFVCVKVDPNAPDLDRRPFAFKSTRYVPEVVLLSPDGVVVDRLRDHSVGGVAATLQAVLDHLRK